jgi:hypothetical protein
MPAPALPDLIHACMGMALVAFVLLPRRGKDSVCDVLVGHGFTSTLMYTAEQETLLQIFLGQNGRDEGSMK